MGRRGFLVLAGLFALTAVTALIVHFATAPTVLRLAAGPIGSEDVRMAAAFVQAINREKRSVRLKLVLSEGLYDSAAAMDRGSVDLAIIRPDVALPGKGETVLITRRFLPFLATRRNTGISKIPDLRGRKIGFVNNPEANQTLLRAILAYYEVPPDSVEFVSLKPTELAAAVEDQRIDALFAVGALSARTVSQGVGNIRNAFGPDPVFIPFPEAEALAARNRAIETGEIVRGAFGGDPPKPAEALPTISVTHRLVASSTLDDGTVAELTRFILSQRGVLAAETPVMQGIEAPSTDRDSALPVHNGTVAYLDGTERSFFDRYGDWFYLGVMAVSLLGSVTAGLLSQASSARRRSAMDGLVRIVAMIAEAREATGPARLAELEAEADAILAATLDQMALQHLDASGLSAYRLAMDQFSRAVSERRRMLEESPDNGPAETHRQTASTDRLRSLAAGE